MKQGFIRGVVLGSRGRSPHETPLRQDVLFPLCRLLKCVIAMDADKEGSQKGPEGPIALECALTVWKYKLFAVCSAIFMVKLQFRQSGGWQLQYGEKLYVETVSWIFVVCFVYPYTDMCLFCMLSTFPESCGKIPQITRVWFRTHDPCNSRAMSHQLDYQDCPVARGSSNPVFWCILFKAI